MSFESSAKGFLCWRSVVSVCTAVFSALYEILLVLEHYPYSRIRFGG